MFIELVYHQMFLSYRCYGIMVLWWSSSRKMLGFHTEMRCKAVPGCSLFPHQNYGSRDVDYLNWVQKYSHILCLLCQIMFAWFIEIVYVIPSFWWGSSFCNEANPRWIVQAIFRSPTSLTTIETDLFNDDNNAICRDCWMIRILS